METVGTHESCLTSILDQYAAEYRPERVESLGSAGGFSGAAFWRSTTSAGVFCLRRWPAEHPSRDRLEWMHKVLRHLAQQGMTIVPSPVSTQSGHSFVQHDGCLWELAPWLPGSADYRHAPTQQKLSAAMAALAQFHLAAAAVPGHSKLGSSPGLNSRLAQIRALRNHGADAIERKLNDIAGYWPELQSRAIRLLTGFRFGADAVERELASSIHATVPLQICIRDIWHDHILFTGDAVTGMVDFGAMRVETVAGDIARLLGSLVGDDQGAWQVGCDTYESIRTLSPLERQLLPVFDRSTVLISGLNWLTWIYVQRRQFQDRNAIIDRLDEILARLER